MNCGLNRWKNGGEGQSLFEVKIRECRASTVTLFSDESADAYGSYAYLRTLNESGSVTVKFVASKAKVVPIKCTATIPRLAGGTCAQSFVHGVGVVIFSDRQHNCFELDYKRCKET